MKYFTLRGPPRNALPNGNDMNGGVTSAMNGDIHSSAHNLSNLETQHNNMQVHQNSTNYYYAQPRQKQRPQLAQHFNLKSCNRSRRSVVGNSNGVVGNNNHNGRENGFVAPKSAPLPRKSYNGQPSTTRNNYHDDLSNGKQQQCEFDDENDFEDHEEGFAIPHNGTLPHKVRRRRGTSYDPDLSENGSKLFSPLQKLLNRQKVRTPGPSMLSKDNLSSPEETENNANHNLSHHHHHRHMNGTTEKHQNNINPEYGELREIVRRIEMQEQSNREAQQYLKQVKHHPVLLVQQKLHHATALPANNMQNEFGNNFNPTLSNGAVTENGGKAGVKLPTHNNKKKNSAFNYLTHSVNQR